MLITSIDYRTGIVTVVSGEFEFPIQMDWDVIPYLRVNSTLEEGECAYAESFL